MEEAIILLESSKLEFVAICFTTASFIPSVVNPDEVFTPTTLEDLRNKLGGNVKDIIRGLRQIRYDGIMQAIGEDKENYQANLSVLEKIGVVEKPEETPSGNTLEIINNINNSFNEEYQKAKNGLLKIFILEVAAKLKEKLEIYSEHVVANSLLLYNEKSTGGVAGLTIETEKLMNEVITYSISSYETHIIDRTKSGYDAFVEGLKYNKDEMMKIARPSLIGTDFLEKILLENVTSEYFARRAETLIDKPIATLANGDNIVHYFESLNPSKKTNALQQLTEGLDTNIFFGTTDSSKIENPKDIYNTKRVTILYSPIVETVESIMKNNKSIIEGAGEIAIEQSNSLEYMQLSKIERGLALCVLPEVYRGKDLYKLAENSEMFTAEEAKMRLHTSKHFLNISEPVGSVFNFSAKEKFHFIYYMIHFGVLHFTEQYNAKIRTLPKKNISNDYRDILDKQNDPINVATFLNNFRENPEWYEELVDAWISRAEGLFDPKVQAPKDQIDYFNKYFSYIDGTKGGKQFPFLSDSILSDIIRKLENARNDAKKRNLLNWISKYKIVEQNKEKLEKMRNSSEYAEIPELLSLRKINHYYAPAVMANLINKQLQENEYELYKIDGSFVDSFPTKKNILEYLNLESIKLDDYELNRNGNVINWESIIEDRKKDKLPKVYTVADEIWGSGKQAVKTNYTKDMLVDHIIEQKEKERIVVKIDNKFILWKLVEEIKDEVDKIKNLTDNGSDPFAGL